MGNWLNFKSQPKEIRIIYITDRKTELTYPLIWSDSFAEFVLELQELFPSSRASQQTKFIFKDQTVTSVCIVNESTFSAIVPKHKQISPTVDLYYCILDFWIVDKRHKTSLLDTKPLI